MVKCCIRLTIYIKLYAYKLIKTSIIKELFKLHFKT